MSTETCEYHPSRKAENKCERCNRLICLSDTNRVKDRKSRGVGDSRSYYIEEYIFCTLCKYDYVQEQKTQLQAFRFLAPTIIVLFFVVAAGMFFWFDRATSDLSTPENFGSEPPSVFSMFLPFFIFGGVMFFLIIYFANKTASQKVNDLDTEASRDKKEFLGSVENTSLLKRYNQTNELTCNQCGSAIPSDSKYCMSCGDPTSDEKSMY